MSRVGEELFRKVVQLGIEVRKQRASGSLSSVPPPTIYGYLAFLRMAQALPHLSLFQVAQATILGNASSEDGKLVGSVFSEVFGMRNQSDQEQTLGGSLF